MIPNKRKLAFMKKYLLFFLIPALLCSPIRTVAQNIFAGGGAAVAIDKMVSSSSEFSSPSTGFYAGAAFSSGIKAPLSVTGGLYYLHLFDRAVDDDNQASVETYRYDALSIPVTMAVTLLTNHYSFSLYGFLGPSLEIGLSSRLIGQDREPVNLFSGEEGQKRLGLYGQGGLGVISGHLMLRAGYQRSITGLYRGNEDMKIGRGLWFLGASVLF